MKIQWPNQKYWTKSFNPVIGCRKVSEGCQNCYAKSIVERFETLSSGDVSDLFAPHKTNHETAPRNGIVFAGNMTDLFGEWNENADIVRWINNMSYTAVNLILTKRAARMVKLMPNLKGSQRWYGFTGENQARYEERMECFHNVPLHIIHKWVSCEPLLGEINLGLERNHLDWVVVGAESGAKRRHCELEWITGIVRQCQEYHVPVFVKQIELNGKLEKDITKFPEELQIREMPFLEAEQ